MKDPLDEAEARFRELQSYRVGLRSESASGGVQVMHYSYRKPGWIRIDCVDPHPGVVLVFDPEDSRVRLWPFGPGFGFGFAPALSLAVDNPLVTSPRGHRLDRSDVGALLQNLQTLRASGGLSMLDGSTVCDERAIGFEVAGVAGMTVAGVHRYRVWLGRDTWFPMRVESFDDKDDPIERVDMRDAELDVELPERFFRP